MNWCVGRFFLNWVLDIVTDALYANSILNLILLCNYYSINRHGLCLYSQVTISYFFIFILFINIMYLLLLLLPFYDYFPTVENIEQNIKREVKKNK